MSRRSALDVFFLEIVEEGIRESRWFRSAPPEHQKKLKIKIIGIENRKFYGLGSAATRPALVAEAEVGGETQRFSLLLDNTTVIEPIH